MQAFQQFNMKKIIPLAILLFLLGSCQSEGLSSLSSLSSEGSSETPSSSLEPVSPASLLSKLSGELSLKGEFLRDYEAAPLKDLSSGLSVHFGEDVWESREEGFPTMSAYRAADGYAVKRSLGFDNEVVETPLSENGFSKIPFSRFENPFRKLDPSDLSEEDGGYAFELSEEEGSSFAYALSGYGDISIASGFLRLGAGGHLESLYFTGRTILDPSGNSLVPVLSFEPVTAEEIGFLYCDSLPSLPEQEAVADLLTDLKGGNYTVSLLTHPEGEEEKIERYFEASSGLIYVEDREGGVPFACYGYIEDGEGVVPFEVSEGTMQGIGPTEEGSISSALPPFDLDPAFFLPEEDGYALSPWGEGYVSRIDPGYLIDSYLEVMVEGSFRLYIEEGGALFSYAYEATDFYTGRLLKGTLEMRVTSIGTTEGRFSLDDLAPYEPPASYEEVDPELAKVLKDYFGGDLSLLPYPSFEGLEGVEGSEGFGYFALYFRLGKGNDLEAAFASYDALLAAAGWEKEENPSGGYDYRIERGGGSGYLHLTLEETSSVDFINLYIYRMDYGSPMDAFFEPLAFSPNSTLEIAISDSYFEQEGGTLLMESAKRLVYEWSDDSEHLTAYEDGEATLERYLVPNLGRLDVYEKGSEGFSKEGTLDGSLLYATATIWNFAYDYGSSFLPSEGGAYSLAYGEASDALIALLYGNSFASSDLVSPIEAMILEGGEEIEMTIELSSPILYGEEGIPANHVVTVKARLSKVGTTVVEPPF